MNTTRSPLCCLLLSGLLAACGGRGLGGEPGDAGTNTNQNTNQNGNQNQNVNVPDAQVVDPCAAMDAQLPPNVRCGDPTPIGWSWNGTACVGIPCECEGADCGALYASEALCYAARAPACLPADECQSLEYDACDERTDCQVVWYGGGCIDLDTCEPGGPGEDNWLCWEQGIACVPADQPCNQLDRGDCDGDCYWWEHRQEACFGDTGNEECCVQESWGYCAALPEHNACTEAGGYCQYGDYVPPTCGEGYGNDWAVIADDPDACGLGICCTPCPDPDDPAVSYVSQDPAECATIDFDCMDGDTRHFDNECGCGCLQQ